MAKKGPALLTDIENPVVQQAFKHFCQHLVSLICRCDPTDKHKDPKGPPDFFGFSGQVIDVRGCWCLLTAGHIVKGIEQRLVSGLWKFQFFLVDDLGPSPVNHDAIKFEYEDAKRVFIDEDGLDCGLVTIRPYYRALLEKNGIVPILEEHWKNQVKVECDRHIMLGFPTEFIEKDIRQTKDGYHVTGALSPTMAYVTKIDAPPPSAPPTKYPRFIGRIGHGGVDDIDGMSGCPIFGFEKGRDDRYWIVAIQSSWYPQSRIIFGSPLPVIGQWVEAELDAGGAT